MRNTSIMNMDYSRTESVLLFYIRIVTLSLSIKNTFFSLNKATLAMLISHYRTFAKRTTEITLLQLWQLLQCAGLLLKNTSGWKKKIRSNGSHRYHIFFLDVREHLFRVESVREEINVRVRESSRGEKRHFGRKWVPVGISSNDFNEADDHWVTSTEVRYSRASSKSVLSRYYSIHLTRSLQVYLRGKWNASWVDTVETRLSYRAHVTQYTQQLSVQNCRDYQVALCRQLLFCTCIAEILRSSKHRVWDLLYKLRANIMMIASAKDDASQSVGNKCIPILYTAHGADKTARFWLILRLVLRKHRADLRDSNDSLVSWNGFNEADRRF